MTRRDAVASFALFAELLASGRHADAQAQAGPATPPASPPPPVFKHDLPNVTMDDWEVTVSYVDYAPGRVGAAHRHPGFVLAYVLEGAVIAKNLWTGRGKDVHDRADVLRTAWRDARGLEERQSDTTRATAGDDLREERFDADDACSGARRVTVAAFSYGAGASCAVVSAFVGGVGDIPLSRNFCARLPGATSAT